MCTRIALGIFLFIGLLDALHALDSLPSFAKIDRHIDTIGYQGLDPDSLVLAITKPCQNESEKLRAIYKYVITHITYDDEAYRNGKRRVNQNHGDILRRKKAVCWGYAQLITDLCRKVGLPCFTITGYAKDSPVPPQPFEKANHAWNGVYLDGQWHLVDATWGRAMHFGENYFSKEYGINYFLSDPVLFGKSHHPLLPMWQLQYCPRSYEDFLSDRVIGLNEDCNYNFQDTIAMFADLSYLDQQLTIMQVAYELNSTATNRSQVGHALVDIAIQRKEYGDHLMERDSQALAVEELEASVRLFDLAKDVCSFYPWQEEAHIFSAINLSQATYAVYKEVADKHNLMVDRFNKAKALIDRSRLKESVKQQVERLVMDYLEVLDAY